MSNDTNQRWRAERDHKMFKMLDKNEPAWLVEEEVYEEKEVVYYTIVHRWKPGGWARRRYTYDTFADVIHFRGTSPVNDKEMAKMKPDQRIFHNTLA
jgi:hypothetical protein